MTDLAGVIIGPEAAGPPRWEVMPLTFGRGRLLYTDGSHLVFDHW